MIKFRIIIIALLIINSAASSQTTVSVGKVTGSTGPSLLVPVSVSAPLNNVKSISFQFSYDISNLDFNHQASSIQSGIKNSTLSDNTNLSVSKADGLASVSWFNSSNPAGVTLNGKLFDLDFKFLSGFSEIRLISVSIKDIQGKKLTVTLEHGSIAANTDPAIKLVSPNGGEIVEVIGSQANITWTSVYITNVKLEFSTDNGTNWETIVESYEAISDSYLWTVPPAINSTECKVKISDAAASTFSDESDAVFTINSTPLITLTTPEGGEELKAGEVKSIKWTSKNIENISIEYTTNASAGTPVWQTIASSVPAKNNSYSWVIPNSVSTDCKIRVSDAVNSSTVFDLSGGTFIIHNGPIAVTVPHTVDAKVEIIGKVVNCVTDQFKWWTDSIRVWKSEKAHYSKDGIEYDAADTLILTGTVPVSVGWLTNVQYFEMIFNYNPNVLILEKLIPAVPELENISYSYDNGVIHVVWGTNVPSDIHGKIFDLRFRYIELDEPEEWLNSGWDCSGYPGGDPNTPTATIDPRNFSDIKIDLVKVKNSLNHLVDVSSWTNGSLAISNKPAVKLLFPFADDTLEVNDVSTNILWASRLVNDIGISYSTDNGANWTSIIASTPTAAGTYTWILPDVNSSTCFVKIADVTDAAVYDQNYAAFTLTNVKAVDLLSPDGGEVLRTGSVKNITWLSRNLNSVNLEYSANADTTWNLIASGVPAKNYTYAWNIPAVNSINCKVRIRDAADTTKEDLSAAVFTISTSKTKISISNVVSPGGDIVVPVSSEQINTATYFNLSIKFNTSQMTLVNIVANPVLQSGIFNYVNDNGVLRIVWFSTTPVNFSGELFSMNFSGYTGANAAFEFDTPNQVKDQLNNILDIEFVNGSVGVTEVENENVPLKYELAQNYPNPFNPVTTIKYAIPAEAHVVITIYNMLGEKIITLVDEVKRAGIYSSTWKADNYASGIYCYSIITKEFAETKKMILLK